MSEINLYDPTGKRLYITPEEGKTFIDHAAWSEREVRTFCSVLYYTGCRISEALELTPRRVDMSGHVIIFRSLKKHRQDVYREVPVPASMLDTLDMFHGIREAHRRGSKRILDAPLWTWTRPTAWAKVRRVMLGAGIAEGPHRTAKGLRHGFAINALGKGVPLNLVSKWMGHSKMETTAIYANAVGEEQQRIAARMWA